MSVSALKHDRSTLSNRKVVARVDDRKTNREFISDRTCRSVFHHLETQQKEREKERKSDRQNSEIDNQSFHITGSPSQ